MSRVLQVVLSLHPGGTERLVLDLVRRLNPEFPMAVCCLDEPGAWGSDLSSEGIRVVGLNRASGFHPSLGVAVARSARDHGARLIHAHHYSPFVYACLSRIVRPQTAIVFTEHGRLADTGPSQKRRLANRALARLARRVCAVSEDVKRHLVGEGFTPHQVGVVYNGIDPGPPPTAADRDRARQQLGAAASTLVIGTVARLDPVKDLGTLIEAAAIVARDCDVHLVIVGDGPEREALERRAMRHPGHRVRFTGYVAAPRALLAGCDVYVNSSITEGVSLTILEAMASELPVVATSVGGTPEVVDRSCGRLVPARDPSSLAGAIGELASDPPRRAALGAAARRRVTDRFALDRMIAEYREIYAQVGG